MTLAELEKEVKKLPLTDRAALLSRVQLTEEERDELEDTLDVNDHEVRRRIAESREDEVAGRVRPAAEFIAELRAEEGSQRRP